ncbi:MAG TPA: hypothetical protein VFQ41_11505 [Candidatus Angelobacter sp.]|nr:hypothetical protein [Candidatus Angelobacter sp.]
MTSKIDKLATVLTSYAYRDEYIRELDGMVPTIREHHPDWPIVTGKGPVAGFDMPTLEVESPSGKCHWSLPVALNLNGSRKSSEEDWAKIALMKPWWIAEVWRNLKELTHLPHNRLVWLDADARLNGPLDIELDPNAEVIAGPWWADKNSPPDEHHICGGLIVFQGAAGGIVDTIITQWAQKCMSYIQHLPPPPPPNRPDLARDDDQKVLTGLLKGVSQADFVSLKLDYDKYCGVPDIRSGEPREGALVDQWMMNEKMRLPQDRDRNWPPPEEARRQVAK